jgi:hypothetical protein
MKGIHGIQFARTYLEIHPTHGLVVLEADAHIGGPWATRELLSSHTTGVTSDTFQIGDTVRS